MHDPDAHCAYAEEFRRSLAKTVQLHHLDLHINDPGFVDHALIIFDRWMAEGLIPNPRAGT